MANRICQCLGEGVVEVLVVLDVKQLEDLLGRPVSNHVGLRINVLDPRVVDVVLRDAISSDVDQGCLDGEDDSCCLGKHVPKV